MSTPSKGVAPIPSTYAELLRCVTRVVFAGRRDIEHAWVRTYHETGRLIHVHLLLHQERADYGTQVFSRLARDTRTSSRSLHECVQVFRCFPIVRTSAQLGWSHYVLLCQVGNPKQREALTVQASKGGWTSPELREHVRACNAAAEIAAETAGANGSHGRTETKPATRLLSPRRGVVGRYRVVARPDVAAPDEGGRLCIDVGFKLYLPLSPAQARYRTPGEIVNVDADGSIGAVTDGRPSDLFTYRATIRRVIDGDTLAIGVTLPHYIMDEKLRLRGLDCPERDTAEGKVAKRAVEALARDAKSVTISTSKPDKYDRYLADVFIETSDGTEIFLNNHLLENGLAEPKDAWEFSDWEKQASR